MDMCISRDPVMCVFLFARIFAHWFAQPGLCYACVRCFSFTNVSRASAGFQRRALTYRERNLRRTTCFRRLSFSVTLWSDFDRAIHKYCGIVVSVPPFSATTAPYFVLEHQGVCNVQVQARCPFFIFLKATAEGGTRFLRRSLCVLHLGFKDAARNDV